MRKKGRRELMKLFHRNESQKKYDSQKLTPVIRSSICTGEKAAGFREKDTGKFREIMLIRNETDLEEFRRQYGIIGGIETIY